MSTRSLADAWPEARTTGLDLSPYMLAAAVLAEETAFPNPNPNPNPNPRTSTPPTSTRSRVRVQVQSPDPTITRPLRAGPITYRHARAEATGLADASQDVVCLTFLLHECPASAIEAIYPEAFRVVRPGGVVAMTDMNPRSPVIQSLPPVLATLMKSTEPWADEYYCADIERIATRAGLVDVEYHVTDPRHRTIVARRPPPL